MFRVLAFVRGVQELGLRVEVPSPPGAAGRRFKRSSHLRAEKEQLQTFYKLQTENHGQNLALIVLYVLCSLVSGGGANSCMYMSEVTTREGSLGLRV